MSLFTTHRFLAFFRLFRLVHVLFYSTPLTNVTSTTLLLFLTSHSTMTIETSLLPFFSFSFSLDSWFRRMRTCNHHLYSCAGRSCRWTFFFSLLFPKTWVVAFAVSFLRSGCSCFTFLTLFFLQIMRISADDKYHTFQNLQQLFRC